MKKCISLHFFHIILCVCVIIFLSACSAEPTSTKPSKSITREYYTLEDFRSIVIGESTLSDIAEIADFENSMLKVTGHSVNFQWRTENVFTSNFLEMRWL